jgi:hypothetical protein
VGIFFPSYCRRRTALLRQKNECSFYLYIFFPCDAVNMTTLPCCFNSIHVGEHKSSCRDYPHTVCKDIFSHTHTYIYIYIYFITYIYIYIFLIKENFIMKFSSYPINIHIYIYIYIYIFLIKENFIMKFSSYPINIYIYIYIYNILTI